MFAPGVRVDHYWIACSFLFPTAPTHGKGLNRGPGFVRSLGLLILQNVLIKTEILPTDSRHGCLVCA